MTVKIVVEADSFLELEEWFNRFRTPAPPPPPVPVPVATQGPAPPPPPSVPVVDQEFDAHGVPWNPLYHAGTKRKTQKGTWRKRQTRKYPVKEERSQKNDS